MEGFAFTNQYLWRDSSDNMRVAIYLVALPLALGQTVLPPRLQEGGEIGTLVSGLMQSSLHLSQLMGYGEF